MLAEYDYAAERIDELMREIVNMRRVGLVTELLAHVTADDLRDGHLGRAFRTALLDAIRWAQAREKEATTAPPPPDWESDHLTPLEEPNERLIENSRRESDAPIIELDWDDCDTSPGFKRPTRDTTRPVSRTNPGIAPPSLPPPPRPKIPPLPASKRRSK